MDPNNPYAAPSVVLIDEQAPKTLAGWSAGRLRVFAWLSLAVVAMVLASLVASFFETAEEAGMARIAGDVADWLTTLSTALGCYLLLVFKAFLERRFVVGQIAAPVYLIVATSLLGEVLHWLWGDAIFTNWGWSTVGYTMVLVLMGLAALWLGILLLKIPEPYPSLRAMAWMEIVGGGMLASVILLLLAFIPLLAGTVASALVFFRGAKELEGSQAA